MAYRVVWDPATENEVARIWLAARDRYRVNEAIEQLAHTLSYSPLQAGESRDGNERIVFLEPIGCRFRVDTVSEIVIVEALWRSR